MKLKHFLYLTQLEEYDTARILNWLKLNPNREVVEIKKKLIWTTKIKLLYFFTRIFFCLPPEKSVIFTLYLLSPFDWLFKQLIVFLAFLKLKLFHRHLTIIAITGSWGKTTTKDTLLDLIKSKFKAVATTGNHNTLLGIAKDILKLPADTQYFVVEIGAYYPGDISKISRILQPKFSIITAIGPMHLERFGTMEKIVNTKMELPESINSTGWIYLPNGLKQKIFHIKLKSKNILFFRTINDVYQHLGRLLDIDNTTIKNILINHSASEHRLQITKNGTITIIDDTYNSNPAGFTLALEKLRSSKTNNRILITPGIIEMGSLQDPENSKAAKLAATICNHLVFVGHTNRHSLESGALSAKSKAQIHLVDSFTKAQQLLSQLITPDAVILLENDLPDNYF